jgi:hypothetical protein
MIDRRTGYVLLLALSVFFLVMGLGGGLFGLVLVLFGALGIYRHVQNLRHYDQLERRGRHRA